MSECPNCGSAKDTTLLQQDYDCGSWHIGSDGGPTGFHQSPARALIRSLREELAAVSESRNNALANHVEALEEVEFWKGKYRLARDAERDQIADWLDANDCYESGSDPCWPEYGEGCEKCNLSSAANFIRSNEHRSNG